MCVTNGAQSTSTNLLYLVLQGVYNSWKSPQSWKSPGILFVLLENLIVG